MQFADLALVFKTRGVRSKGKMSELELRVCFFLTCLDLDFLYHPCSMLNPVPRPWALRLHGMAANDTIVAVYCAVYWLCFVFENGAVQLKKKKHVRTRTAPVFFSQRLDLEFLYHKVVTSTNSLLHAQPYDIPRPCTCNA